MKGLRTEGGINIQLSFKNLRQKKNNKPSKKKIDKDNRNKIKQLIKDWSLIMYELGMYTDTLNTYTPIDVVVKDYGFHCNIYATKGLTLDDLEKAKPTIETGLGCIFLYYIKKKGSKLAEAKFITEGFGGDDIQFIPPKTTPFEIYIGNSVEGTPTIISAKDVSHFLLSGSNGSGKSRLLDILITTLIYNCDETELELYLAQIAKNDLVVYEDALVCRAFCETLNEVETMLSHIINKMAERTLLIKPMRKDFLGSNISDYNRLHSNNKMTVCWVIFDEISSIMENTGNDKEATKQKKNIIRMIEEISRVGRALGVFLGVCLQRCTANMLSPLVKSQTNLRISFAQNNIKSSEVATDDPNIAIGLDDRVAVYSCRARGFDFVKTPYMDDKVIKKYIIDKSKRGHRNLFSDLKKQNTKPNINTNPINNKDITLPLDKGTAPLPPKHTKIKTDTKVPLIDKKVTRSSNNDINLPKSNNNHRLIDNIEDIPDFKYYMTKYDDIPLKSNKKIPPTIIKQPRDNSKVDIIKTEQEILLDGIKKIPNFVPYNPMENAQIIDQTNIDFTKNIKDKER